MKLALAIVALLLPLAPGAPEAARDALPEGCRDEADGYVCEFHTTTQEAALTLAGDRTTGGRVAFAVPGFARGTVTLAVELEGINRGWFVFLDDDGDDSTHFVLARYFPPSDSPTKRSHRDTSTHYIEVEDAGNLTVLIWAYGGYERASVGDFTITYTAHPQTLGEPPARPAATAEDPHVRDDTGDVASPWLDVEAFWFDDAGLDDRLMDAHLKVADVSTIPPPELDPASASAEAGSYFWDVDFEIQGTPYTLRWNRGNACTAPGPFEDCTPYSTTTVPGEWGCVLGRRVAGTQGTALTQPACSVDVETSTFHAVFPESALASPGAGVPFTNISAHSGLVLRPFTTRDQLASGGETRTEDETNGERFAFALGGPSVWCDQRTASCVPALAWYEAPLAPQNQADTLQFVGAFFAVGAFLIGLVLLARRRRTLRRWLDRIDEVVATHEQDARAGLLALGDLQTQLLATLRRNDINESQFQVVAQRIAFAATQLSMRRDLGLDDGVPGEATGSTGVRR